MANDLTDLIIPAQEAADIVSRSLTGLIPAVTLSTKAEGVAVDQEVKYHIVADSAEYDVSAGATGPDPADDSPTVGTMKITKSKAKSFYITGEETKGLTKAEYNALFRDRLAVRMFGLAQLIEADLAALYYLASRAYGTAGTVPFGTAGDFTDVAKVLQILKDNGAPLGDINLVLGTDAGANLLGKQSQAQMQGDTAFVRQGILLPIHGVNIRESSQIKTHTKGTASSATTDDAGYSAGDTTITLASAGTGTIVQGDVVSHARDTANKYVINTGDTDVSDGGTLVLNAPGLAIDVTAATSALTLAANYRAHMAFARSAIHLLNRVPAMPEGGDSAVDVVTLKDPRGTLVFQVAKYAQKRRVTYEVSTAWGRKVVNSQHLSLLIG